MHLRFSEDKYLRAEVSTSDLLSRINFALLTAAERTTTTLISLPVAMRAAGVSKLEELKKLRS